MTQDSRVVPEPNDPGAITVNTGSSTVSIVTSDLDSGIDFTQTPEQSPITYTVIVFMVTEANTPKDNGGQQM